MVRLAERKSVSQGSIERVRIVIRGAVQGVGFRPFVYRLASELDLVGWVLNSPEGVFIEVEGEKSVLHRFLHRLEKERPPRSSIQSLEHSFLDPSPFEGFEIRHSDSGGDKTTLVLPDIATCEDCLKEVFDPDDRRYTNCGPRFSIIESLPYDRARTSMKRFEMCPSCQREYEDPMDRRFHAQPNACPVCGPWLELWDHEGNILASRHEAMVEAAEAIRAGMIVALKGLGGFHLMVDARDGEAVALLRARKHREEKPFAVMFPGPETVTTECEVSALEERVLLSPESPIILLRRRSSSGGCKSQIADAVAPRNPYLGVLLPYTPLHHILMKELGFPVVATSGNLSEEPICTEERDGLERLSDIADLFLMHNRPIVRHVDDSIVRVMLGRELVLRRARGYAPLPISLKRPAPRILAVGGHLKNTVAVTVKDNVFISQHIGDLENLQASQAFHKVISSFRHLYETEPETVAADMHPDYLSTRFAKEYGGSLVPVQHHFAHVLSCMTENELEGPVLGVSWDGTGYGLDGSIWGGEFLLTEGRSFERAAHLREFRLPGGERAIKEPRRTAVGALYEVLGSAVFERQDLLPLQAFTDSDLVVLQQMLVKGVSSPVTSSAGRLFDAVASITGLRHQTRYEGQAAMELEFAMRSKTTEATYPFTISERGAAAGSASLVVDWGPLLLSIVEETSNRVEVGIISAKFHNTLSELIVEVAQRVGQERLVLSGGCFQNKYLTERTVKRLEEEGFRPYWHQRVPPNDGGLALGQVAAAFHSHEGVGRDVPSSAR
jgi:hydrogenase maturation protein HypF